MNITAVLNSKWVDEVWLIPTGRHRFKQTMTPAEQRKSMVEIMLATVFGASVPVYLDTTELEQPAIPSTTFDLIRQMRAKYPDYEFSLIIGADLVEQIPYWAHGTELLAATPFLIVPRLGCNLPPELPSTMRVVSSECHTDVSSSTVRAMIRKGMRLDGILPPGVLAHIRRHGLYREETGEELNQAIQDKEEG